ncbi:isoprenylcysteine carboxylmethyltransferase family protein [Variovorax ureilyticus]|uniref:Isoprenylcysteine carboxylmethyltransferase family protein n=1 Tax=Variovorax ureilyticus TaxID=1836198 RepID=A0ABU8VPH4_9BURK
MNALELKVPPPVVALVLALAMWAVSRLTLTFEVDATLRIAVAVSIALVGGAFSAAGISAFRRVKTTLNPMKPESASSLVTSGIYRVTRNPMYVGLLFVLVAWAAFLCAPWALAGPVVFMAYMNRFQIAPEERALLSAFGEVYAGYTARVRRWL